MNARLLTLITLTVAASISEAGKITPTGTFSGFWTGVNGRHGPGATGGTLFFTASPAAAEKAALSAGATPITGSVIVPLLRDGGFESRAITSGFITPKGRIRAKFKGGYFNGHTNRGNHDAGGFMYVNVQKYRAVSFWYADDQGAVANEAGGN